MMLLCTFDTTFNLIQACCPWGCRGCHGNPCIFVDQLTLFQPWGADYAQQLDLYLLCLESFRRACKIIIYCCCHFSLRFSPFRSTYNTHVGKSSVSYSYTAQHCCSGESAKEISFLSFNGFGEHMEWASISFRSIRHFRTLHSATL